MIPHIALRLALTLGAFWYLGEAVVRAILRGKEAPIEVGYALLAAAAAAWLCGFIFLWTVRLW